MSTDGRLASGAYGSCAGDIRRASGCDRGEGRGGLGRLATPSRNRIVWMAWVIGVPKAFHPLQELEVIPLFSIARERERTVLDAYELRKKRRTAFYI